MIKFEIQTGQYIINKTIVKDTKFLYLFTANSTTGNIGADQYSYDQ